MADSFVGGQLRSVAAAATDDLTIPLPFVQGKSNYLTSFTVAVDDGTWTGFGGTVNANGPHMFGVEVWLKRKEQKLLLDKGWAIYDCKYQRTVVGFAGRINFKDQDVIFVAVKNGGAITSAWTATGTVDVCESPVNETDVINRLHDDVTWIYQARRINTQGAGGGGALITRISLAAGQTARLVSYMATGPVSNTAMTITLQDEDAVTSQRLLILAAGVSVIGVMPQIGPASTGGTANAIINSTDLIIASGQYLYTGGAAAAVTETLTIAITLELLNDPTLPTWDTTGSGGTPSLAASTISVANTLVPIVRPRMIG